MDTLGEMVNNEPHPLMELVQKFVQKIDNRFSWLEKDIRDAKCLIASERNPAVTIKPDAVRHIEVRLDRRFIELECRLKVAEAMIAKLSSGNSTLTGEAQPVKAKRKYTKRKKVAKKVRRKKARRK